MKTTPISGIILTTLFAGVMLAVVGSVAQATTTTIYSTNDAEIDQHVNWRNDTKGIPHPEWDHTAEWMRVQIYDPNEYPLDPNDPDPNDPPLESWALIKWDVSSINPTDPINKASLRAIQWDGGVQTCDVYAVDEGNWDESTVTWNNWVGTETLDFLGTMTNVGYPDGVTTFTDANLAAWVQDWVDGDQENYGVLLKWSGDVAEGDTFAAHESSDVPPRLIVVQSPAPAPGTVVLDAVADAEIDQHVNYNTFNLGSETSMRVEVRGPEYQDPVESPPSWALIKWDLSSIDAGETVNSATFEVVQTDAAVGTIDVYAIDEGNWDESTVTWSNWVGTETLDSLGTMTDVTYPDGNTTFSSEALTNWIQDWVDGTQENYGLLLKWSATDINATGEGDTFATREEPTELSPRLILELAAGLLLGDVNGDGEVDNEDVDPFLNVLLNGPFKPEADMNEDDQVNGMDVDLFVAKVVAAGATQSVPEPSALALAVIALLGLAHYACVQRE